MRETIQAYKGVAAVICLLGLIVSLADPSYAEESYTKTAEMVCGDTKVTVVTQCYDDSHVLPSCSKQEFQFVKSGGAIITKAAAGKLEDDVDVSPPRKGLDALASQAQCVRGKSQSYLVVMYYNGGNCEKCEWAEILDLKGEKVSTDWPKTKKSLENFDKAWKRLGLSESKPGGLVPDSQYMKIPLRRKDNQGAQ